VTEYTDEGGNVFTTEYDSMGNITAVYDADGNACTRTEYDKAGNVTKTTNALDSITEYTYDSLNRLIKNVSDKGTSTESTTTYTYDAFGRIIETVDAENGRTQATYDNTGNILSITDPNGGTSTYKYDSMNRMTESENAIGSKNTYTYNAQGLLAQSKNARNQSTVYTYDKIGRITSTTDELGTIRYTYDANGNILTVTDENGNTATREYDCMNRVTKYTDFRGNTVKYSYDTLGNLISLEYAGGRIVRYTYYPSGRLKSVVDWNNRSTNYEYDGNGRITKLSRPDGSVETYQYDALGQLVEQTDLNGDKVINSFTYTYDTAGHIIKTESENVAEETVQISSATMEYDDANRLVKFNGEDVVYDADGNMTYGPLNGVMTHFTYDCRNRLVSAGNTTYEYDAENNRIAVTANNVRTEYVVENNASQYSQILSATTNGETTLYIYGDGLLSQVDEDGNYLYYHFNNIGSTTVVTGDDGKIVHAFTYGTYGELLSGDTHGIMFLYNGRYGVVTDQNGLYYMRARYYNTDIKRFINQDVVEGNITNSPSLNRYAYCQGNPVSLLDPFGLSPQISWSAIGHGVLDVLGMIPGIGAVADIANGFWYLSEGDYFSATSSFVSAIPGVGDIAGGIAKGITGCTKISKAIKFATRFASNIGNFALGAYDTATQIYGLWDKYVTKGEPWGDESLGEFLGAAFTGVTTVLSGKGVVDDIANYKNTKHDILTSQCFVEGTLVVTADGNKPIEEIQAGDLVYSTNPETGESEYKEVLRTFRKETDVLIHIFVNGEEIQTTPVHPFWVENQWVAAKDLETGDILTLADGTTATVTKTYGEQLDAPVIVYNFEVSEFHTYYVTDTGVLVHNDQGCVGFRDMMSSEEVERYDAYWYDIGTQKAVAARDAELKKISKWSATKQSDIITVVGAVDLDNGEVAVGIKSAKKHRGRSLNGKSICAEDLAIEKLGGNKPSIVMTSAIRPRKSKIIPVCTTCQKFYSRNQFMKGVTFQ